jgi:hypothetical protein
MSIHSDVYEFAARAGALEGFVYRRDTIDADSLVKWVDHLIKGYEVLPSGVRKEIQDLCTGTIGRAIQSLLQAVGEDHEVVTKLKTLTAGKMPSSPDDFGHLR